MTTEGLVVRGVVKHYNGNVRALAGVDLRVAPGRICAVLGENGAGKTTLLSLVAGLLSPDEGSIHINGVDVLQSAESARAQLGFAPQELGIYPTVSVRHNLRFFGELAGVSRTDLNGRVEAVATMFSLVDLLDRPGRALSGGEKRRLHSACALMHRPAVVLLDEPTAGVDVRNRLNVIQAVRQLASEGAAVCYSTHYLHEVEELDADVAILEKGSVIAEGAVRSLIETHGSSWVEVEFIDDGEPPPKLDLEGAIEWPGERIFRIGTSGATPHLEGLFSRLGAESARVARVDVVRPSMESVFLSLTGRRYAGDAG